MSQLNYSKLTSTSDSFSNMMQHFAVVTVMEAKVYEGPSRETLRLWSGAEAGTNPMQADEIYASLNALDPICELKTLKIANVTIEGPDKTITGGRYNNPLIKYGKSARLEMQDALGHADAIDRLCGGVAESETVNDWQSNVHALHFGEDFNGIVTIVGDTFFINAATGQQVKAKIIFYQFNPDSIFNLVQDAEGDATVFDMNGDLLTTDIGIADINSEVVSHGVFYTILDVNASVPTMNITLDTTGVTDTSGRSIITVSPSSITESGNVTITWTIPEGYEFDSTDLPRVVDEDTMDIATNVASITIPVTFVADTTQTFAVTGGVVPLAPSTITLTTNGHGTWSAPVLISNGDSATFTPASGYIAPNSLTVVSGSIPSNIDYSVSNNIGTLTLTADPIASATLQANATPVIQENVMIALGTMPSGSWAINDNNTYVNQPSVTVQTNDNNTHIYIFENGVATKEIWTNITATGTNTYVIRTGTEPDWSTPGFYVPSDSDKLYAVAVLLNADEITLSAQ